MFICMSTLVDCRVDCKRTDPGKNLRTTPGSGEVGTMTGREGTERVRSIMVWVGSLGLESRYSGEKSSYPLSSQRTVHLKGKAQDSSSPWELVSGVNSWVPPRVTGLGSLGMGPVNLSQGRCPLQLQKRHTRE